MKTKIAILKEKVAGGVSPAMVTPLLPNSYRVDTAVTPQLVNFLIDKGVAGLFVGGTTGEGILLDRGERERLHEVTMATVNGRIPVILHIGDNHLDSAILLARQAQELGADAIAAVTPYYYGMHDAGLAAYYESIATAVPDMPLFLYSIPQMAVNTISPALITHLSQTMPSLAGIKTSQPQANLVREVVQTMPDDRIVLAGNENIAAGMLALGVDGLISGFATAVPEPFVALTQAVAAGNLAEAQRQQRTINQMLSVMPPGARIGALKMILNQRGIDVGTAVPTLPTPSQGIWDSVKEILGIRD